MAKYLDVSLMVSPKSNILLVDGFVSSLLLPGHEDIAIIVKP